MEVGEIAWWEMDCATGAVRFHRRKTDLLGYPPEGFTHYTDFTRLLHPDDHEPAMQAMRDHLSGAAPEYRLDYRLLTAAGDYRWFEDRGRISRRDEAGRPLMVRGLVTDITARKRMEQERERLMEELQAALELVKTLKGILPICASCKNIRDADGSWRSVEVYMSQHSEARFSHGVCPECLERLYPDEG